MNRFGDIDVSNKRLPPVYGYRSAQLVSIDKALEPIVPQIDQLLYYVKTAKKNCHYPSEHGLSKDESASIYIYTMEWGDTSLYRVLNQALRSENRQLLTIWFPYLKLFETAFDKLPTVKKNVWRGVPLDIGKSFIENQIITWWPISSCSSSVKVIENFIGNSPKSTLFLIEAKNGKQVSGYTEYENEKEVVLRIGSQFRVTSDSFKQSNSAHVVHMVEIDDDDDDNDNDGSDKNVKPVTSSIKNMHLSSTASSKSTTGTQVSSRITNHTQWKQHGITVAGGNGQGDQLNRLHNPLGLSIDNEQQSIYIADFVNNRIVEWKFNTKTGQVVAGRNGRGNQMNQLNGPADVLVDTKNNSLIICDEGNRRVVEWSRQNGTKNGQILISDIDCSRITMDKNGYIYVSDDKKHEVRRWKRGEPKGIIVAGGNGQGDDLNQLNFPRYLFVDQDDSVYVSDSNNHRVMKWIKNAKEGVIVSGGQGEGVKLTQLSHPRGVIVDHLGNVYVTDCGNHRIMCWSKGSKQGRIIVGGNGGGEQSNQLSYPIGISFDRDDNLYVADQGNNRVQKFEIDNY